MHRQPFGCGRIIGHQTEVLDAGLFKDRRRILTAAPDLKFLRTHQQRTDDNLGFFGFQKVQDLIAFSAVFNRVIQLEFLSDADRRDDIVSPMAVNPAAHFTADNRNEGFQIKVALDILAFCQIVAVLLRLE